MNKFLFTLTLGSLAFAYSFAQSLKVKVCDATTQKPIEFATIAIYVDTIFYKGDVTNSEGIALFDSLPHTQFKIKASCTGYEAQEAQLTEEQDFTFSLNPTFTNLSEITVEGNKTAFTSANGVITFNPSFIPDAMNAAQIVSNLPGIIQEDRNISMIGKSGIVFYINGRRQKGSPEQLMQQLLSYSAKDVDKVEIIRAPMGQYATLGNNGAINIILKKKPNDYMGGNLSAEAKYADLFSGNAAAGIIYRAKRLQTTLNIAGTLDRVNLKEHREYIYPEAPERIESSLLKRRQKDLSVRLTLNYDFSKNWNGEVQAYYMPATTKWNIYNDYSHPLESQTNTSSYRHWQSNTSDTWFAGGSITGKLRDNMRLEGSLDYFYQNNPYKGNNLNTLTNEYQWIRESGQTSTSVLPKINFTLTLPRNTSLNFGVDFTHTTSHDQTSGMSDYTESLPEEDFQYNETVGSFYASASTNIYSKLSVSGTLNYEYSWIKGKSTLIESSDFSRNNGWLSSALSFRWSFLPGKSLSLGFYDNLARPSIAQLNPTLRYTGSYSYRQGNPGLSDQRHYLTYIDFNAGPLNINPYIEWLKGGIEDVISIVDQDKTLNTWTNATDRTTYAITASFYKAWERLRLSVNAYGGYDVYRSCIESLPDKNSAWSFRITPSLWLTLDDQKKWTFFISGSYVSQKKTGTLTMDPRWNLNARLSWNATKALSLSIAASNILASHVKGHTNNLAHTMRYDNKYLFRGISLSVSYNWGIPMGWIWQRDAYRNMKERSQRDL